jgi:hypothetical protein
MMGWIKIGSVKKTPNFATSDNPPTPTRKGSFSSADHTPADRSGILG